jgi:site-specific DNA-methyltransferase (adenine-specific)
MKTADLRLGDCLEVLRAMPDASIDAIVTDPPYGLAFMGKRWDYDVPGVEVWAECLRVLRPGGHLLAFAGTRTQHRMACRIEDAGFEIRDMIAWVYGSGFPKSLDVSKAIDKAAGAEREVVGPGRWNHVKGSNDLQSDCLIRPGGRHEETAPNTSEAQQWAGWGTALKPALEPITMARKPFAGTVAANVLEHGTGALNVDGCRVAHGEKCRMMAPSQANISNPSEKHRQAGRREAVLELKPGGRWPSNLIHDGSDEVVELFPEQSSGANPTRRGGMGFHGAAGQDQCQPQRGADSGSAARFFYTAKATAAERQGVTHPTVKPLDLMAYLCRLVTPPAGIVLDPFMGSGTTVKAAISEGFRAIGIERDPAYFEMAQHRLNGAQLGLPFQPLP